MDSRSNDFANFLASRAAEISLPEFVASLLLAALSGHLLGVVYIHCGRSLSNRKTLAGNFVVIATTTATIITIVKSSLALSLGLVGALSIVRFRAAIKEPEELSFLFLAIAAGLGFGANQWAVTLVAVTIISLLIFWRSAGRRKSEGKGMILTLTGEDSPPLQELVALLKEGCQTLDLRRLDQGTGFFEAVFLIEFEGLEQCDELLLALRETWNGLSVSVIDNRRILL